MASMRKQTKANFVAAGAALAVAALAGAAHADEAGCKALMGRAYPASVMSLPQTGARITKADWTPARANFQAYCKVAASVAPVDPKAPPVLVAVNLPDQWNKKAVQWGGGGLNGTLVEGTNLLRDAPPGSQPLAKGYVTLGTDGGHPNAKPEIGIFFLNQEAVFNNAYGANKKGHDLALAIVNDYYQAKPDKFYFFGGSEGGRQAMIAVQKYPQDYDGVVAVVPALQTTGNNVAKYNAWLATLGDGWLNEAQIKLLDAETSKQCDNLDGVADGVISKYRSCLAVFKFDPIRCKAGPADTCLTDKQISAVQTWRHPYSWGFPLKNGYTGLPGWSVGGEALPGSAISWITLEERQDPNSPGTEINASQFIRYYVMRDGAHRGPVNLKDPAIRARLQEYSEIADQNNPDLTPFFARGGKLIIKENTADYAIGPEGNFVYFEKVKAKMGAAKVNQFIRFYVNPGVNHGGSGTRSDGSAIPDKVDLFGEMVQWAETGKAPGPLTVTAYKDGNATATKPLCQYPLYPRYKGTGDKDSAASFSCVAH